MRLLIEMTRLKNSASPSNAIQQRQQGEQRTADDDAAGGRPLAGGLHDRLSPVWDDREGEGEIDGSMK